MRELTPALGPYSHFKCYDSLVFASGQIPIDADGKVYSDAISTCRHVWHWKISPPYLKRREHPWRRR